MGNTLKLRTIALVTSTAIASMVPIEARAQSSSAATDPSTGGAGSIIVTATRRAETVLSVPLSITALTADALAKKAATNFFDYASSIPNLSFGYTNFGVVDSRTIGIRGIADAGTTGVYIDDTPVPETVDPKIFDIDRIEVLRGPQGTLYGARSMSGTIRFITVQPDPNDFSARIHGSVSGTSHSPTANYQLDGTVNIPLAKDKLALRISALHEYEGGYITRQFPTSSGGEKSVNNVGAQQTTGVAASLLFKPTEDLSITPRILYQKESYNGFPFVDVAVPDPEQSVRLVPTSLTVQREFDIPESARDRYILGTLEIKLQKDFGTFVSATSYFDRRFGNVEDNSLAFEEILAAPLYPVSVRDTQYAKIFTQEGRFSSDFKGPFQIVAGGFYSWTKTRIFFPAITVPQYQDLFGDSDAYLSDYRQGGSEIAGYAEGTLKIIRGLSVTAGARVFVDRSYLNLITDGFVAGGLTVYPHETLKESGVNPKFSAQYKFSSTAQVYATAAKGFRPGGLQQPAVLPICAPEEASLGLTPENTAEFHSDHVWSYEVGAKGSFLDHKLTASAAAFRIDWSNIQQNFSLRCGFLVRLNAGTARSQGFELELNAHPLRGLEFNLGFGYTDATIRKSVPGGTYQPGDRIPQVPKTTVSLDGNYDFAITDRVGGFLHADFKYVGNSVSTANASRGPDGELIARLRPSYSIVDARAGVTFGKQEIAVFGKNLANKIASLSDVISAGFEAPGRARVAINQPRTIGIEFSSKF